VKLSGGGPDGSFAVKTGKKAAIKGERLRDMALRKLLTFVEGKKTS